MVSAFELTFSGDSSGVEGHDPDVMEVPSPTESNVPTKKKWNVFFRR
jgi:hypothetical protein